MKEEVERAPEYAKDPEYEAAVTRVNALLRTASADHDPPRGPVLFLVGLPRSGTTLLHQVLAASGGFGYCSNLVARFYERPALGALVQALVAPWLPAEEADFSSRAGATRGWSGPHEFGYFWEEHFPFSQHHEPEAEDLELGRIGALLGELEAVMGRPLLFKNVILTFVLPHLDRVLSDMRVVRIRRDRLDVALSIADLRRAYFGTDEAWFSVRPRGAETMRERGAPEQIAYQIARVEAGLDGARAAWRPGRWLEIEYEDLCRRPRDVAARVGDFVGLDRESIDLACLPETFTSRSRRSQEESPVERYQRALAGAGLIAGEG